MSDAENTAKREHWTIRRIRDIKKAMDIGEISQDQAVVLLFRIPEEKYQGKGVDPKTAEVEKLILDGLTPSQAARKAEVAESTAYRARARLVKQGKI